MKTRTLIIIAAIIIAIGFIAEVIILSGNTKPDMKLGFNIEGLTNIFDSEKLAPKDIDIFLEIYDRDFSKEAKEKFKKEFDKLSRGKGLDNKKVLKMLSNVDNDIADQFKTWYFSSRYKGNIELDGTINFKKTTDKNEINKNLKFFDNGYKKVADKQDTIRKELFEKLRSQIEQGNISFNKRDKKTEKILFNVVTFKLEKFANLKTEDLLYEFINSHPDRRAQEILEDMGIEEKTLAKLIADRDAYYFLMENDLTKEQFDSLAQIKDIQSIKQKLGDMLTIQQKEDLSQMETTISSVAKNIEKRGLYTEYTSRNIQKRYINPDNDNEDNAIFFKDKCAGVLSLDGRKRQSIKDIAKIVTKYTPTKQDAALIKKVFANVKLMDINTQHSQIVDVANIVAKDKMPKVLINFDSHSDLYNKATSSENRAYIADWVNYVASIDNVEKIIWVVPKHSIENNPDAKYVYFAFSPNLQGALRGNLDYTQIQDISKPFIQKLYLNVDTREVIPVIGNKKPSGKIKVVDYIVCTQDTIPDLSNQDVFMSLDGDYFNNCGFDTSDAITTIPTNINKAFSDLLIALDKHNIRPKYLSCTTSPEYVSFERIDEIHGFYNYLLSTLNMKDQIKYYYNKLTKDIKPDDTYEISEF